MRNATLLAAVTCAAAFLPHLASAQPAERRPGNDARRSAGPASFVDRMMAFDANEDGYLTKAEVTDERLHRLFDRADADKDGRVTKRELTALVALLDAESPAAGVGGPAGRGGPGGPGGRGGPGMRGGPGVRPPRPGQVLPPPLRDELNLTDDQRQQLDELQKDVDARLARILTPEQKRQLDERRPPRGPRGGFGPGGPPDREGAPPPPPPPPPPERPQ